MSEHATDAATARSVPNAEAPCVLVVDDDLVVARAVRATLVGAGLSVETVDNAQDAIDRFAGGAIDVIVADVNMPGASGLDLLRAVRATDADAPVILMTGAPDVRDAAQAVEFGALRYLSKPVDLDELVRVVERAGKMRRLAALKRDAMARAGNLPAPGDRAGLAASFDRALASLRVAYQPLVGAARDVVAFEALLRSAEPTLPHPGAVLDAGERLGRLHEVGRAIRGHVARDAARLDRGELLFVNLHPADLEDPALYDPGDPLRPFAARTVLEITERASLDHIQDVRRRVHALRELGYRVAVDDLGAGYAGLTSFAHLEPEIVKLDMSLIRGIEASRTRQRVIQSMSALCHDLGATVVAEGIETESEWRALVDLGCDLFQGYFFARPGPPFPVVVRD